MLTALVLASLTMILLQYSYRAEYAHWSGQSGLMKAWLIINLVGTVMFCALTIIALVVGT